MLLSPDAMQGGRPDAMRALPGTANAAARRAGRQTFTNNLKPLLSCLLHILSQYLLRQVVPLYKTLCHYMLTCKN